MTEVHAFGALRTPNLARSQIEGMVADAGSGDASFVVV